MKDTKPQWKYYSFFTKYSLMEDYGFSSGLLSRLFHKVIPKVPPKDTVEYVLVHQNKQIDEILELLDFSVLKESRVAKELDLSIMALGAKVVAFGLDSQIKAYFDTLVISYHVFEQLHSKLSKLDTCSGTELTNLTTDFDKAKGQILHLRKSKKKIGTSLHLTVTTRRILDYITRIQELLQLKQNIGSRGHWKSLFVSYKQYAKIAYSIRRFGGRHLDLVALEIVEHTASKGEKYIAESKEEYWSFFRHALLGGAIIAVFALIKICMGQVELSPLQSALYYSLNYAACFVLVKQVGGIIATKQPAVTASTIVKNIDANDDLRVDNTKDIAMLVRKVSRSQFISIMGNFLMAVIFACTITVVVRLIGADDLLQTIDPSYLVKNTLPTFSLVFYAAIAGCFLAFSGLISGLIDNKVVASNICHRIANSKRLVRGNWLASYVVKKSGALIGNVSLGFLLGCAFLASYILPFSIDIRHIAFSSANVGYAIMQDDQGYRLTGLALTGALLIGLVNFLVSFSITFLLALKSRNVSSKMLPTVIKNVVLDFFGHPLSYFIFRK